MPHRPRSRVDRYRARQTGGRRVPEVRRDGRSWTVTVLPGLVRQVWFTFHVTRMSAGDFPGAVVAESADTKPLQVPIRLRVWPLDFPQQTTLWLGGWSYTNGNGTYGVTARNRPEFLEHLQTHFVNAPWATGSVMLPCEFRGDPPAAQLDTREFDDWIAQWPKARQYMVFLGAESTLGGAEAGTPSFDRHVAAWITAWVRYLRRQGNPARATMSSDPGRAARRDGRVGAVGLGPRDPGRRAEGGDLGGPDLPAAAKGAGGVVFRRRHSLPQSAHVAGGRQAFRTSSISTSNAKAAR